MIFNNDRCAYCVVETADGLKLMDANKVPDELKKSIVLTEKLGACVAYIKNREKTL